MPKKDYPLPEYSTLVRWTMMNVTEWLTANGLGSCVRCFVKMGVDGNKLVHITKTDLESIGCPKNLIRTILDHVAQVQKPGSKKPGVGSRQPAVQPSFQHNFDEGEASGSEDDIDDWPEGEFDDDDVSNEEGNNSSDNSTPEAPPRIIRDWANGRCPLALPAGSSSRPPMPIPTAEPAFDPEDYVDPDANLKVSKIHRGPLPQPPTETTRASPVLRRPVPVPSPTCPAKKFSEPVETSEENYEDPDLMPPTLPPPIGRAPVLPYTSPPHRASPIDDLLDYEEPFSNEVPPPVPTSLPNVRARNAMNKVIPQDLVKKKDLPQPIPSREKKQPEKPKPSVPQEEYYVDPDVMDSSDDNDDNDNRNSYLVMEQELDSIPLPPPRVKVQSNNKPPCQLIKIPQYPPPENTRAPPHIKSQYQPAKSPQCPPPEETQDDYEMPEEVTAVPSPWNREKQNGVRANNSPVPTSQPKRPARELPPTPLGKTPPKPDIETPPAKLSVLPAEGNEGDITTKNWFHGNITRAEAEEKLKQRNINGMYLIRQSKQGGDKPYTLQIYFDGKCYNLPIRVRIDNRYAIGQEKADEKSFATLTGMINMFKLNALVLQGGKETKLKKSLPKN